MCKACKLDPNEVQKQYERQGAVDPDDFEIEFNYQKRTKGKGWKRGTINGKEKARPGCPENDFKAHIYVWTSEFAKPNAFSEFFGYQKYEREFCAGCGKRRNQRLSEKYQIVKERRWKKAFGDGSDVPRGQPIGRRWRGVPHGYSRIPSYEYWDWEDDHAGWVVFKKEYLARKSAPAWSIDLTGRFEGWW